jgi:RHH-type rel operon transcriptional repressor/antitoxin RelB
MSISISLSSETEQRLDFLVTQTERSKADYLREIIENSLEDLEDSYLATQVLERVRSGQEKVYSASEVRKELGLDDQLH